MTGCLGGLILALMDCVPHECRGLPLSIFSYLQGTAVPASAGCRRLVTLALRWAHDSKVRSCASGRSSCDQAQVNCNLLVLHATQVGLHVPLHARAAALPAIVAGASSPDAAQH